MRLEKPGVLVGLFYWLCVYNMVKVIPILKSMKLYQYPKCSTCRKAVKFLNNHGVDYKSIDIAEKAPSKSELKLMLASYDGNLKKLFNTSGQLYRQMELKDKVASMSEQEAIELLANNGMLVKRPFLVLGSTGTVGFKEDVWQGFVA